MSDLIRCKQIDWTEFSNINDSNYTHVQSTPSTTWEVNHQLKKRPSVRVVDENNLEVYGDMEDINDNFAIIRFLNPLAGKAYFN